MKLIYSAYDELLMHQLRGYLEGGGVPCVLLHEALANLRGETAVHAIDLMILDDEQFDEARCLIDRYLSKPKEPLESWRCRRCGEELEGQFSSCWKCGFER